MDILNVVWFVLIAVLFTGFFILEGFDYGVGMLLVGKSDSERSLLIRAIAPVWDGNEVWMITAGGALFAAFPHVYATMFSTFYLALFLMLLALILRGVAFELRGKYPHSKWRKAWDCAIIFGSTVPALLWGVAVANLIQGLPIDAKMHYLGNFFDLLSVYTLFAGLAFTLVFLYHGAAFLLLKIGDNRLLLQLKRQALPLGIIAIVAAATFIIMTALVADLFTHVGSAIPFLVAALCLISSVVSMKKESFKSAFIFSTLAIAGVTIGVFTTLFPRLMVSSLNSDWSLTIYNAASTSRTLAIMTAAAAVLIPIVLIYQGMAYRIFKGRDTGKGLSQRARCFSTYSPWLIPDAWTTDLGGDFTRQRIGFSDSRFLR